MYTIERMQHNIIRQRKLPPSPFDRPLINSGYEVLGAEVSGPITWQKVNNFNAVMGVAIAAITALVLVIIWICIFKNARSNIREDIEQLRAEIAALAGPAPSNASYVVIDDESDLPCSRTLEFDPVFFVTTDHGCGSNLTVQTIGAGNNTQATYLTLTSEGVELPFSRRLVFANTSFSVTDNGPAMDLVIDVLFPTPAPSNASYLVLEADPDLPCGRTLEFDPAFFSVTDHGCGSNLTVQTLASPIDPATQNATYLTLDPEGGDLPLSRRLVFEMATFSVTDNGPAFDLVVDLLVPAAPANSSYFLLEPNPDLPCARVLDFDLDYFTVMDDGCGSNLTVRVINGGNKTIQATYFTLED